MKWKRSSERQIERRCGFERQYENMALKAKMKMDNDFECQKENMALNAKWKMINGSKRQTKNAMMTLNAKTEKWWGWL